MGGSTNIYLTLHKPENVDMYEKHSRNKGKTPKNQKIPYKFGRCQFARRHLILKTRMFLVFFWVSPYVSQNLPLAVFSCPAFISKIATVYLGQVAAAIWYHTKTKHWQIMPFDLVFRCSKSMDRIWCGTCIPHVIASRLIDQNHHSVSATLALDRTQKTKKNWRCIQKT